MALAFDTGTINGGSAGAVGQLMSEKMRDNLEAHPAWELVEQFDSGTGLTRYYVFRCLAAVSGLANDFYFIVACTLGDGVLRMFVAEGYDAATNTVTKFPAGHNTGTVAYDSDGCAVSSSTNVQNAHVLGTTTLTTTQALNVPRYVGWAPSGVSTKYWTIVDDDGFTVAFNGAANGYFHCGKYDWLAQLPNPTPVHSTGWNAAGNNNNGPAGITRNPAVANLATGPLSALMPDGSPGSGSTSLGSEPSRLLGFAGRLDVNDALLGGERSVAEVALFLNPGAPVSASDSSVMGQFLGKVKRCRFGLNPPAGVSFGDAYVNNGTLWVPVLPSYGLMFDTGVAA